MNPNFRSFLFKLFILTLILCGFLVAGEFFRPDLFISTLKWPVLGLFIIATILQHYFLLLPENQAPAKTVRVYMATSAVKLMAFVFLIVIFVLFFRPEAKKVIVWFLVFYVVFTAFENVLLFRHFKGPKRD